MAYQAYAAYNSAHYPQATYPHFAQYQHMQTPAASTSTAVATPIPAPAATTTATPVPKPTTTATTTAASAAPQSNGQEAHVDISTLNDALGSAGVDLKVRDSSLECIPSTNWYIEGGRGIIAAHARFSQLISINGG